MDVKQIISLLIRHFGAVAVAWLAATGQISENDALNVIVGVAAVVAAVIWSIANKYLFGVKVETALSLPAGTSKAKLEDVLAQ